MTTTISVVQGSLGQLASSNTVPTSLGIFTFDTGISNYTKGQTYTFTVNTASRTAFDAAGVQVGDYISMNTDINTNFVEITTINGYVLTVICRTDASDGTPATWSGEHIVRLISAQLLTYAITTDGAMSAITEKVNGVITGKKTATSGQSLIAGVTQAQWDALKYGKYSDAVGGLNTLTITMGADTWTYTFGKRLTTTDDMTKITKSIQDVQNIYLPAVKAKLGSAIRAKGITVNDTDSFDTMTTALQNQSLRRYSTGVGTQSTATLTYTCRDAVNVTYTMTVSYFSLTGLPFKPKVIILRSNGSYQNTTVYDEIFDFYGVVNCDILVSLDSSSNPTNEARAVDVDGTSAVVTNTSFTLPIFNGSAGQPVTWEIYG